MERNASGAESGHLQVTAVKEIHLVRNLVLQSKNWHAMIWSLLFGSWGPRGPQLASSFFARYFSLTLSLWLLYEAWELVTMFQGQLISALEKVQPVSPLITESERKTLLEYQWVFSMSFPKNSLKDAKKALESQRARKHHLYDEPCMDPHL